MHLAGKSRSRNVRHVQWTCKVSWYFKNKCVAATQLVLTCSAKEFALFQRNLNWVFPTNVAVWSAPTARNHGSQQQSLVLNSSTNLPQSESLSMLRAAHGTRKILLVGKDQQRCTCQALFLQESFLRQTKKHRFFPAFFPLGKFLPQKINKNHQFNWTYVIWSIKC